MAFIQQWRNDVRRLKLKNKLFFPQIRLVKFRFILLLKYQSLFHRVILTPEMLEAAEKTRHDKMAAAMERMRELQAYNEAHVLGRQKYRCQLLEKLFVGMSVMLLTTRY